MVTSFPAHEPVTPAGKPLNVAPVAPEVANIIGVIAVFIQIVWLVPAAIVFWLTVIIPDADTCGRQPPVVVTL